MNIALLGNPNSGKSTLFNALTGAREKTGNWTGVTTVRKTGKYVYDKSISITDLPGVYSFSAETKDEKEVENFLKKSPPDVIINVVDGTNLERNLYLTTLIIKTGIPCVVALNFSDEAEKKGINANEKHLEKVFGVKFVKISAKKRKGLKDLLSAAKEAKFQTKALRSSKTPAETYSFIGEALKSAYTSNKKTNGIIQKIDDVLTGKFFGLLIFFAVIFLTYFLSLKVGGRLGGYIEKFFSKSGERITDFGVKNNISEPILNLFISVFIKGIGSVLSFLPQVLVLFTLLSVLEESGYMARVSFLFDRIFRTFGLGGKSVFPFVLSCGCAVTGISATATIKEENERRATIFLCPFMPCGAKTAVFGWFSYRFFGGSALIAVSLYFLGILVAAAVGLMIKSRGRRSEFILEMPPLRTPSVMTVFSVVVDKTKEFLIKSGTVILAVSLVFWCLRSFGPTGYVENTEQSFLYYIGNAIKYLFYPIGINDWKCSIALVSGIFAKEAVIETAELLNIDFLIALGAGYKIFAFMTFVLLSPPCSAALVCAKKELNDKKSFINMLFIETAAAYSVSSLITIFGVTFFANRLIFSIILSIILLIFLVMLTFNRRERENVKRNAKQKVDVRLYEGSGFKGRRRAYSGGNRRKRKNVGQGKVF